MEIPLITADYWLPWRAFQRGIPWITPHAIVRLCELLQPEYTVLEFGSGGSTIYFSKNCKSVVSYETSISFIEKVQSRVGENVRLVYWGITEDEQVKVVESIKDIYDVVLLDSMPWPVRCKLLPYLWNIAKHLLIVDNYNNVGLSRLTCNNNWIMETYDDFHWQGWGTAVCVPFERSKL